LLWKSNKLYLFWVCVCRLRYSVSNAHAPYCQLWPLLQYLSTLSRRRHDIRKKKNIFEIQNIFWIYFKFNLKHFSFQEAISKLWKRCIFGLYIKFPLFSSNFNQCRIFMTDFRKILKYKNSWQSVRWEQNCSTRTDGRTWRT